VLTVQQDKVYQNGGRNFLFLTIPPTDLSPLTMHEGPAVQAAERADITVWNDNVFDMAKQLYARYNDVSAFVFDTHALFTEIIGNPCSHAETCAYQNTDEWCPACKYMKIVDDLEC
jgi:phospholipase/lecithinase/hemolysin